MKLTLRRLIKLWGEPCNFTEAKLDKFLGEICTDTRRLKKGDFFLPLIGKYFDGHNFIDKAYSLGAQATIIERNSDVLVPHDLLFWFVDDTLKAFHELSLLYRQVLDIPVVAITGSAGKTTTRQMISSTLKSLGPVKESQGNNNNEIGVPLTITGANKSHKVIVVEMGMRGLGEIARLSDCSNPDIAVITNIGSAHIGLLGSRENIANAKCEITYNLKRDGVVIIPAGDELLDRVLKKSWNGRVVRVGLYNELSKIKNIYSNYKRKVNILGTYSNVDQTICIDSYTYKLPIEGIHNANNFLLSIAVARELGVDNKSLNNININIYPGRNRILKIKNITILDETYNASPESIFACLNLLVSKPGRHFAVLGRMLELGEKSIEMHQKVIDESIALGIDGLIFLIDDIQLLNKLRIPENIKNFFIISNKEEVKNLILKLIQDGDVVLLKASRKIGLEYLIPFLCDI
tara:strand:- start:5469 stop:6857 length:1389 start_codon:yes stop_codon:yes gene_type:complete